ncbi:MAG: futalosine hydrolase [Chitinophagaceae bacterium]
MKIALVAATWQEIAPIQDYLAERLYLKNHHQFSLWVTGVGLVNTTYNLTRKIALEKPDMAIQAGIAGSFQPLVYSPGDVVAVKEEIMGDQGVMENNDNWNDIFDLKLADPNLFPFKSGRLPNPHIKLFQKINLPLVSAVSVNEITTSPKRIHLLTEQYAPAIESMEGAAFHYVCLNEGIPFIQIRSISNRIGERDKSQWQMNKAIENLQNTLSTLINKLAESKYL